MNPVTIINLILCIVILVMGIIENSRTRTHLPLYVAIAFGLFGLSHLMVLLGMEGTLAIIMVVIRLVAYLLVIYSLYLLIAKKSK